MKLPPLVPRFTRAEIIFSLKCFAAAMLALFLASWAGQPRPFWAMMTSYIVAHPLAGAVRSKGTYRLVGTLVGSCAAILLVPMFSNAPELLSLALALWVAACLFWSLQDRTPRSYAFMLAGYTAALIGFPAVDTPLQIFDIGVARTEEIGLGMLSALLVHSLVLPAGLSASVLGLIDRTLGDTRQWLADLLRPQAEQNAGALGADRRRVAGDITQLRLLSTHIPYDVSPLRWTADAVHGMQDRVAGLTSMLSAVEDRLRALEQAEGGVAPDIAAVLAGVGVWLQEPLTQDAAQHEALRRQVGALTELPAKASAGAAWDRALRIGLAHRLEELLEGWHACLRLRRDIEHGRAGAPMPAWPRAAKGEPLHLDTGMALLSGLAALLATCLCAGFWILTGWPGGSAAAMMAAIFSCFFAGMDDPVPAIHGFLKWTLWSVPIAAVYVLVLLPLVQDMLTLAAVLAPVFLVLGAYVARPSTMGRALPVVMGVAGALAMHDTGTADLVSFANSMLGQIFGIAVAAQVALLMRSVGADWAARRIQRATWRELGELAQAPGAAAQGEAYGLRVLDRIALLAPRIAQAGGSIEGVPTDDALRDLRLGADIVGLQREREALPAAQVGALMNDLAGFFRLRIQGRMSPPAPRLLDHIDAALVTALAGPARHALVSALVGLRRNLFPAAAPMAAAAEPSEGSAP